MRIEQSILHIYPLGQKFRRNRSISHGLGDTSNLRFIIFVKNSKIQNGHHFWKEEKFLKNGQSILQIYPVGQKFHRNRSISHGLGDTSNFKFYHFVKNSKVQNGCHFWKEEKFLRIEQSIVHVYPVGQKFRQNRSVYEIQAILSFTIFVKNSKIQNGCHFWKEEKFLRIEQSISHIYPLGQIFRRNHSISHGLGDTSNLRFTIFVKKSKIQNGCQFWKGEKFLNIGQSISLRYCVARKFR